MKQVRVNFSGGINTIIDKSLIPDTFATVLDNADLRSGFPRCVKEPQFSHLLYGPSSEIVVGEEYANTKQIFSYRGRWLYSDNHRNYATSYLNGIERIYWSEDGNEPKKMIEGTEVYLGTARPTSQLNVSQSVNIVPTIVNIETIDGGALVAGTYTYAVSAEFANGISTPSNTISKTFTVGEGETEKNIKITWTGVRDAIGYIVWGRTGTYSTMQRLKRLDAANSSFIDNGTITPREEFASSYFDSNEVSYVYTYERNVNSVLNESGLSPISEQIKTTNGRTVVRDFLNDGFFAQNETQLISDTDGYDFELVPNPTTDNYPYYDEITIKSYTFSRYFNQVTFVCNTEHNLTTGETIKFVGGWKDTNYIDKTWPIIYVSPTEFAIAGIPEPSDSIVGELYNDGLELQNQYDNYLYGTTGTFPIVCPTNAVAAGAEMEVTVGNLQYGVGSITDWSVNNDVSNDFYKVGDILKVALPATFLGGESTLPITGIASVVSMGTEYAVDGVATGVQLDTDGPPPWGGSGYPDNGTWQSPTTGAGNDGLEITGYFIPGTSGGELAGPIEVVLGGLGYEIDDVVTLTASLGGTGGAFKVTSLEATTYTEVDIIAATDGTTSGTGAKATVVVGGNGSIGTVTITDGGSGYSGEDLLTVDLAYSGIEFKFIPSVQSLTTDAVWHVTSILSDYKIAIGKTRVRIGSTGINNLLDGDAVYLNMKDSSNNGLTRISVTTAGSGFYNNGNWNSGDDTIPLEYPDGFSGNGTGAEAHIVITNGSISDIYIPTDTMGSGYEVGEYLTFDPDLIPYSSANVSAAQFIITAVTESLEVNGLFRVYRNDPEGNPITESEFDINTIVTKWENPVQLGAYIRWTPSNGYYKTWNIYRTGPGGFFQLVEKVDIYNNTYNDTTSAGYLGLEPTSYYTDTGIFGSLNVDFNVPPVDLTGLTSHYGMLFGISGNSVRWTPIGQPDAWPVNFQVQFPFRPLALSSFAQGLIVLCEDAVYRIDGNQPASLSQSKTLVEDGCIAPYSVQATSSGLVYLSKRGVMLFDGIKAVCITDVKIPARNIYGPSKLLNPVNFWWIPTKLGYFYSNFASPDTILQTDKTGNRLWNTRPFETPIYEISSFYRYGKYHMYFTGTDFYEGQTCLVIDLQVQGYPITTLGMKALNVFVDEFEDAYALFENAGNAVNANNQQINMVNWSNFKLQNCKSEPDHSFISNPGLSIWRLFSGDGLVPIGLRSGQKGFGNSSERRKYETIEFYGDGFIYCRLFVDGRWVGDNKIVATESPNKPRKFNLPRGQRVGYVVDFEAYGETNKMVVEYVYNEMVGPS